MKVRNTFIIFIVSGFWHGANWTFIIWGALNAAYFLPLMLGNKNRHNIGLIAQGRLLPNFKESIGMISTFSLTVLAWIFFRAENVSHAFAYISEILSSSLFSRPNYISLSNALWVIGLIIVFLVVEWQGREGKFALENFGKKWKPFMRYSAYYAIVFSIFWFGGKEQQFIYFQF